ncbi:MAG: lysophospholipid acyltransferase family protein [Planctomycetota bacterium]
MSDQTADVPSSFLHYAMYRAIGRLTTLLPLEAQYAIARMASDAYFKFDRNARESVCANMEAVLGPGVAAFEIREAARSVFQSFGRYITEFFAFHHFSGQYIDRHVMIQGREHVDAALKAGRGALFCSGHYSNWELGPAAVAQMGYRVLAVVQMHADPRINALFVKQRAQRGVEVVHSRDGALRAMKALKSNRTVAMLGDRATGGPTVDVQWFGRTIQLPQGPWRIALKTGAALLPTFVARRPDQSYFMEICAPISVPLYNNVQGDCAAMAQAWAARWEQQVRRDPTQWEVFYPLWTR